MMTLTEFLLARIAEDEGRLVHEFDCERFNVRDYGSRQGDCDCDATARLLAECEAKKEIVKYLGSLVDYDRDRFTVLASTESVAGLTLATLASVYAGHPDYRNEWKP